MELFQKSRPIGKILECTYIKQIGPSQRFSINMECKSFIFSSHYLIFSTESVICHIANHSSIPIIFKVVKSMSSVT